MRLTGRVSGSRRRSNGPPLEWRALQTGKEGVRRVDGFWADPNMREYGSRVEMRRNGAEPMPGSLVRVVGPDAGSLTGTVGRNSDTAF